MTDPMPPLDEPMADLAHERLRLTAINAIAQVTADMDRLRAQVVALTERVTALEPVVPDDPPPVQ